MLGEQFCTKKHTNICIHPVWSRVQSCPCVKCRYFVHKLQCFAHKKLACVCLSRIFLQQRLSHRQMEIERRKRNLVFTDETFSLTCSLARLLQPRRVSGVSKADAASSSEAGRRVLKTLRREFLLLSVSLSLSLSLSSALLSFVLLL
jgi:hypothetical protein